MKPPQLIDQTFDVCRLNKRVVVIRQYTPREGLVHVRCQHREQVADKIVNTWQAVTNAMTVFITSRRNQKSQMSKVRTMRR